MAISLVILVLLVLLFIVNFVLDNLEMFQQAFIVHLNLGYLGHYASQPIQFMYIIATSVLAGALTTAIPGWLVNTRLRNTMKKQKKELENLQQELESFKQMSKGTKSEIEPIQGNLSEESQMDH